MTFECVYCGCYLLTVTYLAYISTTENCTINLYTHQALNIVVNIERHIKDLCCTLM